MLERTTITPAPIALVFNCDDSDTCIDPVPLYAPARAAAHAPMTHCAKSEPLLHPTCVKGIEERKRTEPPNEAVLG